MKISSEFKENKIFEKTLKSIYPENVCNIIIEWTDEALRYVFAETDKKDIFKLGRFDTITSQIDYSDEFYTCEDVLYRVIREMEHALDDESNESRCHIEGELRILLNVL